LPFNIKAKREREAQSDVNNNETGSVHKKKNKKKIKEEIVLGMEELELYEYLCNARNHEAKIRKIKPFMIFSNDTVMLLAKKRPSNEQEMKELTKN